MKTSLCTLAILVIAASCSKNDQPPIDPPKVTAGVYALNEGNFNGNNTTLTYFNFPSGPAITDVYKNANGSGLGDTGNDMIVYGGKLYIVMNVSSYVEVADALSAKSIKKIAMKSTGSEPNPIQPRHIIAYKNKILVSSWDGTVAVIDTASLNIEKSIKVGANPEQMAVYGNNLYVANSGGITPGYDSTVSVIDLASFTETSKIVVGKNPTAVTVDAAGNLYVGCTGNYADIGPKLVKINPSTGKIVLSVDKAVAKLIYYNGMLYATGGYLGAATVQTISPTDLSVVASNIVSDGTTISIPYALAIDESNGDVYVGDAVDYASAGKVYCFDKQGKIKFSFSTGTNPNSIALVKK